MSLEIDDLKAGQYVTVLQGAMSTFKPLSLFGREPQQESVPIEDMRFHGHVLKIEAIDLPYILVRHIDYDGVVGEIFSLNVGGWKFKKLNNQYVEKVIENKKEKV